MAKDEEEIDGEEEVAGAQDDVALSPNDNADDQVIVDRMVPQAQSPRHGGP